MIDMLMIMVVYLLVHAADTEILPNTENISIPLSISEQKPREATVVTVTRDMLYVNGEPVVSVADVGRSREPVVEPLRVKLRKQVEEPARRGRGGARGHRHGGEVAALCGAAPDRRELRGGRLHQGVARRGRARAGLRQPARGLSRHRGRPSIAIYELPWTPSEEEERRFERVLGAVLGLFIGFGIVIPLLPEKPKTAPTVVPERVVEFLLEQPKPKPKPPPKVVPPKPVELPKVEIPVEKPVVMPREQPKPDPRKKAQNAGLLALSDQLAELRDMKSPRPTPRR